MDEIALGKIAEIFSGSAVTRNGTDARAVMVGDLDGSGQLSRELTFVGKPLSGEENALKIHDVVISLRGNASRAAVIDASDLEGLPLFATLDLAVIRIREPLSVNPDYVAAWLNLPATQASLAKQREGSRLSLGPLKSLPIPMPDWLTQTKFVDLSRAVAEEARLLSQIAALRNLLMHECMAKAFKKDFGQ